MEKLKKVRTEDICLIAFHKEVNFVTSETVYFFIDV